MKENELIKKNLKILRFLIGDVRDKTRLEFAIDQNIDVVVHTAAMKRVPATEYNHLKQ